MWQQLGICTPFPPLSLAKKTLTRITALVAPPEPFDFSRCGIWRDMARYT